jgi:hypothetical protein
MRRFGLIAGFNLVALAIYVVVAARMGFFSHMSAVLFSSPDSHAYRDVANWLFGSAPNPFESQRRPFLFPLFLGAADRAAGATGIWLLNFVCWLGTVNMAAVAAWRMTGRRVLAAAVFLVIATNISLIVLSFQALTESMTAMLEAAWVLGLATAAMPPTRARDIPLLVLPLTLLTVVRPGNEIALLLAVALVPIAIWRMAEGRGRAALAAAACGLPLLIQLALMVTANHVFGLSSQGAYQFKDYYASEVYAAVYGLPSDLIAARREVDPMSNGGLLIFLLSHPVISVETVFANLHDNLTAGSNFIDPAANPTLAAVVRGTNKSYALIHLVGAPMVAAALWIKRDLRLALLATFLLVLLGLSSLINTQGDRYVEMLLPLWPPTYALAISLLWSARSRTRSPSQSPSIATGPVRAQKDR